MLDKLFRSRAVSGSSLEALIAGKNYARAVEILRARLKGRRRNVPLRQQLAEVLVLDGKPREAVSILMDLADKFALADSPAKAIAVLKKIQKIDPTRPDVEEKLAYMLRWTERQKAAPARPTSSPPPSPPAVAPEGSGIIFSTRESRAARRLRPRGRSSGAPSSHLPRSAPR
jgi:hypothetical protein